MTKDEAKNFLTRADLEKIQGQIESKTLQVNLANVSDGPMLEVRGKQIPFFEVLELIGTL